jgi:hypothetical protein
MASTVVAPEPKVAFGAYEPKSTARYRTNSFKLMLVAGDCLLLGLQPVLVHLSKNKDGKYNFNPVSVNFMVELTKTTIALIVLLVVVRSNAPRCCSACTHCYK